MLSFHFVGWRTLSDLLITNWLAFFVSFDRTSSVVLDGWDRISGMNIAMKVLRRQIQSKRIKREVLALRVLGGHSGVIGLLALCNDPKSGRTALILEKVKTGSSWLQV